MPLDDARDLLAVLVEDDLLPKARLEEARRWQGRSPRRRTWPANWCAAGC